MAKLKKSPSKKFKLTKFMTGVIAIFLLGLSFCLGIFYQQKHNSVSPNIDSSVPATMTARPSASPLSIGQLFYSKGMDTSHWKSYRNTEIGFFIKYPSDLDISSSQGMGMKTVDGTENQDHPIYFDFNSIERKTNKSIGLILYMTPYSGNIEEFISRLKPSNNITNDRCNPFQYLNKIELFSGLDTYWYSSNIQGMTENPCGDVVYFQAKGYVFTFQAFFPYSLDTTFEQRQIQMQMLKTLSFVES